jgi:hypothetical protein
MNNTPLDLSKLYRNQANGLQGLTKVYGGYEYNYKEMHPRDKYNSTENHVKGALKNPWIIHVKNYREKHPHLTYKEAISEARKSYYK